MDAAAQLKALTSPQNDNEAAKTMLTEVLTWTYLPPHRQSDNNTDTAKHGEDHTVVTAVPFKH